MLENHANFAQTLGHACARSFDLTKFCSFESDTDGGGNTPPPLFVATLPVVGVVDVPCTAAGGEADPARQSLNRVGQASDGPTS